MLRLPRRLRVRLALSHALVATVSIALVLALSLILLRRYETQVELERLAMIARPLATRANVERVGGGETAAARRVRANRLDEQAAALDVRLIVVDALGAIVHDTEPGAALDDATLDQLSALASSLGDSSLTVERRQVALGPRSDRSPFLGDVVIASSVRGSGSGDALILVSSRDRFPLLRRVLGPMILIIAAALLVAVGTGLLLSRRIARPVERLTAAIDAMAAGGLDQRVEGEGSDELGRLVGSFNTMSRRVASSSRSQRDLLANVAHELRTPLTSIRGFSRAIIDGVVRTEGDRAQALATVDREAERMSALIGELLDLARLEGGAVSLDLRPVPIGSLLDEVVGRLGVQATSRAVDVSVDAPSGLTVWGDRGRLVQVFSNLLANALSHTPAGGSVRLLGRGDVDADRRPVVVVTVSDTGSGIEPDRVGRVFDRFIGGDATSAGGGGFGLGLSIVRELVALHGGKIVVESEIGVGTAFTVTLPRDDAPASDYAAPVSNPMRARSA